MSVLMLLFTLSMLLLLLLLMLMLLDHTGHVHCCQMTGLGKEVRGFCARAAQAILRESGELPKCRSHRGIIVRQPVHDGDAHVRNIHP